MTAEVFSPVGDGARVSSPFLGGFRSSGGHSGVDFAVAEGTPVQAAVPGRVISVGRAGKYGNLVKVAHEDGSEGYYAHLQSANVRPGTRVQRGALLGRSGSTGNTTGAHLHFEVRQDGSPVDPRRWLQRGGTGTDRTVTRDNSELMAMLQNQPQQQPQRGGRASLSTPGGGFTTGGRRSEGSPVTLSGMLGDEQADFQSRSISAMQPPPQMGTPRPSSDWGRSGPSDTSPRKQGGNAFTKLLDAIGGQESGGNYTAVNPDSGALGKYQIMPANIPGWSREALGYEVTARQFLHDRQVQERIARHRLGQYYNQYGAEGAALAWYAGPGALDYSASARDRSQGRYPSMNDYVRSVLDRAGI